MTFDPRTSLDEKSTLSFLGDGDSVIAKFSSSKKKDEDEVYKPFIVHGDAIKFRFEASIGDTITKHWGYRFYVSPLRGLQWTAETQVLKDPSLQWACWVLGFLLRSIDSPGAVHNRSVRRVRGCHFTHITTSLTSLSVLVKRLRRSYQTQFISNCSTRLLNSFSLLSNTGTRCSLELPRLER